MQQLSVFVGNLVLFLLFCLSSVLAGIAIMRLSGLHIAPRPALVIAPTVTMAFWTVGLGIGVALRTPVYILAIILWPLTIGLIVSNFVSVRRRCDWGIQRWIARLRVLWQSCRLRVINQLLGQVWPLVVCAILPVAILLPLFFGGLAESPGTPNPDSWSYVAEGQYLWERSRGDSADLSALHLHGLRVSNFRYVSGSLLAFFSPLFLAGETHTARGLLVSWSIFVFAGACAFFGILRKLTSQLLLVYLLIIITLGWVSNAVLSSNYDNLVSLAYFPAFAGFIELIDPRLRRWQILSGFLGAGMLYAYPELALFTFSGAILILSHRIYRERHAWRVWTVFVGGSLIVVVLLISPFLREMIDFLLLQTRSAMIEPGTGVRPGEGTFAGLLSLHYQPSAFWGLGGERKDEFLSTGWIAAGNVIGILFTVLGAIGFFHLIASRQVGLATALALLLFATFIFIFRNSYAYGAYKVIFIGWWIICFSLVCGLERILGYFPTNRFSVSIRRIVVVLLVISAGVFGQSPNIVMAKTWHFYSPYAMTSMGDLRQIQQVDDIIAHQPLAVIVDDWYASMWAAYFLRNAQITYIEPRYYLLYVPLKQSMPDAKLRYVLTDARFDRSIDVHWRLVWSHNPYRLWHTTGDWALVTEIQNKNGVERLNDNTFFWMGPTPTSLKVLATKAGMIRLQATYFPGPGVLNKTHRHLLLTTASGVSRQIDIHGGEQIIDLSVEAGINYITLQALDQSTIVQLPSGDTRSLVLGVQNLTVSLSEDLISIEQVENPNGIERLDGKEFFWMGKDRTTIKVWSVEAGGLLLRAHFMLGPSLPGMPTRQVAISTDRGYRQTHTISAGDQTIDLPIGAGETLITLTTLDTPTVSHLANGDTRPLVLGVQGLQAQLDTSSQPAKK
jgi:hypothetical protein